MGYLLINQSLLESLIHKEAEFIDKGAERLMVLNYRKMTYFHFTTRTSQG